MSLYTKVILPSDLDENSANICKVEEYLTTPCLSEDADPLIFWKKNESNYLELSRLACSHLQMRALCAPVERLFSIAGKYFVQICQLADELIEKLMFIRANSGTY